ncbi:MAG: PEP-CTERM sorting domain-containing protein [Coleofasciculaceae cyanobacterium RL_1_1]|nr:PEP-CTERM sorting domain-containing protein [Coleofasciculaceae cyanobacterium RL_1_1]
MQNMLRTAASSALLGLSFLIISPDSAFAKPKDNGGGGGQTGATCSTSDIKDLLTNTVAPISCFGSFSGNNSNSASTATLFGSSFSGDYGKELKLDAASGTSTDGWFKITNNNEKNDGEITFLKDVDYQFSFVLKAAKNYSSYLFDGVTAGTTFAFKTDGVAKNDGGSAAGLSHASLYISDVAVVTPDPETPDPEVTDPETPITEVPVPPAPPISTPTEIPEPSTALSLLAFGAVVKMARRRQAK